MKTYKQYTTAIALLLLTAFTTQAQDQSVIVNITNIRNDKGNIRVGIFKDDATFQEEKADRIIIYAKDKMKDGTLRVRIPLAPGEYGISLLDDEDKDGEMTFNMIHIPKEGFGFSNYYHKGLSMPHFNQFNFRIEDNKNTTVQVKMKYM